MGKNREAQGCKLCPPCMFQYVDVKNWDRVDITRAAFRGEVYKRGALVPTRYLDDTRERLACQLKLMCRCRCLPVLERIASECDWEPGWDRCLMCGNGESESIEHFVLRCGAYGNAHARTCGHVRAISRAAYESFTRMQHRQPGNGG